MRNQTQTQNFKKSHLINFYISKNMGIIILGGSALLGCFFYFLAALFNNFIFLGIGISCFIFPLLIAFYYILLDRKPLFIPPEEIKQLNDFLENEEIKEFARYLHHRKHMNIYKIVWLVEKKYKVELCYKKGNMRGTLKPGLYKKIKVVLGYKDYDQFWKV